MSEDGTKPKGAIAAMDDLDRAAKIENEAGRIASEVMGAVQSAASMNPPPAIDLNAATERFTAKQAEIADRPSESHTHSHHR